MDLTTASDVQLGAIGRDASRGDEERDAAIAELQRRAGVRATADVAPSVLVGIDIPFGDLVKFMVMAAIASVPAAVIAAIVYVLIAAIVGGVLSSIPK